MTALKKGDVVRVYDNDFLLSENQMWQPGYVVPMNIIELDAEKDRVTLEIHRITTMKLSDLQKLVDARADPHR